MTWTKDQALHDKITLDGTDVSGCFRTFGQPNEDSTVDFSGFSQTGTDETQVGTRAQRFEGEAYYTEELYALLYSLWQDRSIFEVTWQPEGLIDDTREVYVGQCQINGWNPQATRGEARTFPLVFTAADASGIAAVAAT